MAGATYEEAGGWKRRGWYAVPAVLALLAAWTVWNFAHQQGTVRREAPSISTIIPVQEPPPPPPPPVKPPEPKPVDEPVPQPTPQPQTPTPTPQSPSPAQATAGNNAITENGPPQAGSDAFGLASGLGGGMRGSGTAGGGGINLAGYASYLKVEIARLLKAQSGLTNLRANFQLWVDTAGRVTRVEAVQSGGPDFDFVRQGLVGHTLRAPPTGAPMPVKLSLDVRTGG